MTPCGAGRRWRATALLALVWWLALAPAAGSADEIIERVLAVAAGDVITLADVTAARSFGMVPVPTGSDPVGEVLDLLIERSLVLAEVDRYAPPEPVAADVDRELGAVRARFGTASAFDAALARVGMDERYLRETLRQDLRIRAYIEQRFTVPPPTDDELGLYYRAHPDAFTRNGQLIAFEDARDSLTQAVAGQRRQGLVDTWVAGLLRRAEVTNLYLTSK